ncbi:hypothetical protein DICPUDRAFT_76139 [Dictyostelium purpureum]|uniref:Uncharacterized protein n=1 Tax=Dictyostelium purpureum TaxID=5786 RepID=F0ZCQ3_DICPU|nr:uncharacterized protein DICPUDRAFT_76139 [Dictyostelium purpureum]EGC38240.1 hypothetical protein DICPUDRAFT_76139 [Dictyostelium purpureum]|eukprot:XP_003285197.1 hypothetical protein DICPUDRAFT_76139 [Dictyostelium purpureum]
MIEQESEQILKKDSNNNYIDNNNSNSYSNNNINKNHNINFNNIKFKNTLVLRKDIIRDRFENYYFPNQLEGYIDKLEYHSAISNINSFKSNSLIKFNLSIFISSLTIVSFIIQLVYFSLKDPLYFIHFCVLYFSLIVLFYIIIKTLTFYKFKRYIHDIDILFLGINETFEKQFSITFVPIFHKTFKLSIASIVLSIFISNTCVELSQIEIQYPSIPHITNSSKSMTALDIDGANSIIGGNTSFDIVGNTSLANSPFTHLV